jgi:hypothetical protein
MPRRPNLLLGRSDEVRRTAHDLQRQCDVAHRRRLQTLEQLRRARASLEARLALQDELRRAEDRIRDEYHDSRAITVNSPKPRT